MDWGRTLRHSCCCSIARPYSYAGSAAQPERAPVDARGRLRPGSGTALRLGPPPHLPQNGTPIQGWIGLRHFLSQPMLSARECPLVTVVCLVQLQEGKTPLTMAAHDKVANHYQVSTIHLAQEISNLTLAKTISWQQYGGTHPKPFGNSICTAYCPAFGR